MSEVPLYALRPVLNARPCTPARLSHFHSHSYSHSHCHSLSLSHSLSIAPNPYMAGAHEHRSTLEQGQETAGRVETVPGKPATASGGAFFKETRDDFARDEGAGRCGPSA